MNTSPVDPIQAREFRQLTWHNPRQVLINYRFVESQLPANMDDRVRRLRTNELKKLREGRDAAIFAFGLGEVVLKSDVLIAKSEKSDYDFVVCWSREEGEYFYPVQLKELPPDDLNPQVSLEDLYMKASKYNGPTTISMAIKVNRSMALNYRPWGEKNKPNINELWLFGCSSQDQSEWFIYGDVLKRDPRFLNFKYPTGVLSVA